MNVRQTKKNINIKYYIIFGWPRGQLDGPDNGLWHVFNGILTMTADTVRYNNNNIKYYASMTRCYFSVLFFSRYSSSFRVSSDRPTGPRGWRNIFCRFIIIIILQQNKTYLPNNTDQSCSRCMLCGMYL